MPDSTAASPELTAPPLTEVQRVVGTFTAPSKTFTDILRKATFWGPLLIMILVSIGFAFAVQQKIGWDKVYDNNAPPEPEGRGTIRTDATGSGGQRQSDLCEDHGNRLLHLPVIGPDYHCARHTTGVGDSQFRLWRNGEILAGLCGQHVRRPGDEHQISAGCRSLCSLASRPDSFLIQNPVGTNIGYYLSPDAPKWLTAL